MLNFTKCQLIVRKSLIKVLIYISTLENHRKGWSREIPEPVFSIYLTILFPLLSKQKPKTYLYRLLLLPCCWNIVQKDFDYISMTTI